MKCAILGDRATEWVAESEPDVRITQADFDTMSQTFLKAGGSSEPVTGLVIGQQHADLRNMYITSIDLSQKTSGIWQAKVEYTGIYPSEYTATAFAWVIEGKAVYRTLYKPVQMAVRTYTDSTRKEFLLTVNDIATPRLTATEEYITDTVPDNTEIWKTGSPLNPPTAAELIATEYPLAFFTKTIEPSGWILNTRNWTQVNDKDLYKVTDEWIYQIPEEFAVVA